LTIRISLYLIPLFFFGIFAYLWQEEVALGKESLSWPTVTAKIIGASYGGRNAGLFYSYSVADGHYNGRRLEFCKVADNDLKLYFASNIQNKTEITISYRPSDPRQSVARPGMDDRQFIGYYIITCITVFGILVMERYFWRYFRPTK